MSDPAFLHSALPMMPIFGSTVVTDRADPRHPEVVAIYKSAGPIVEALAPERPALDETLDYTPEPTPAPGPRMK